MGWGQSKKYISESEISDDDLDYTYFVNPEQLRRADEMSARVLDNSVDAVMRAPLPSPQHVLSLEELDSVEEQLDNFEIVSLLYLLYENSGLALQVVEAFVNSGKKGGLLNRWALSEQTEDRKWNNKLLEALCIVQNYQVLKNLGYNKIELQHKFLPFQVETSCAVVKLRKVLYLIAEKLTRDQTSQFISNMKKKLSENNIPFRDYNRDYLELYFLYWELHNNIRDIQHIFKIMDWESYYDQLTSILPPENTMESSNNDGSVRTDEIESNLRGSERRTTTTKDNTYLPSFEDQSFTTHQPVVSDISRENSVLGTDRYPIDPENPGVVLIINQESFYTEPDEKYKHLLHKYKDEIQLEARLGTSMDKERLKTMFRQMKFKVIVHENETHYSMLKLIEEVTDSISEESSLIICILSHGDKGVVYGANSCKVKVSKIQSIMCKRKKKLVGKPKVLILQSCQGERCQKMEEENIEDDSDDNAMDGPTKVPPTADLVTFWATIPGYAAIRNKKTGSWFIQALCNEIKECNSKVHFLDICTRAVDRVTRKEWKEESRTNIMTPMVVSTLTKSFYLPPLSI